jgi:hypothetical protein
MEGKILVTILGTLFVLVSLNGCTEFFMDVGGENEVIPVSVFVSATVKNASGQPVSGVELRFDFSKTNGQDFRSYRTTDEQGYASVNQYSYNLHKGEIITATCTLTQQVMIDEKTASYDRFLPAMKTHATTTWYESFEFTLD